MSHILKYREYISESNYTGEWPLNNQQVGMSSQDVTSDPAYAQKENKFQQVQELMKVILKPILMKKNPNVEDVDVEKVSDSFFHLGNNKAQEVKKMVDGCKDMKQCAQDIVNRYLKYVKINFNSKDNINDVQQDSVMTSEGFIDNILYKKIPEKYREIYKKIKKAFSGKVYINFNPDYQLGFPFRGPEAVITVTGENRYSGSRSFYCKRDGMPRKEFSGTVRLIFYLERDYQDIMNWLDEDKLNRKISPNDPWGDEDWDDKKKKSDLDDFIDNFDAYQGEGSISPTKDVPYEFIDLD